MAKQGWHDLIHTGFQTRSQMTQKTQQPERLITRYPRSNSSFSSITGFTISSRSISMASFWSSYLYLPVGCIHPKARHLVGNISRAYLNTLSTSSSFGGDAFSNFVPLVGMKTRKTSLSKCLSERRSNASNSCDSFPASNPMVRCTASFTLPSNI